MLPFLAQVHVIDVTSDTGGSVAAPATPSMPAAPATPGSSDDAAREIRANVARIKADAAAIARTATAKAKAELEQARISTAHAAEDADNDKDDEGSGDTTVRSGTNSVVIHHKKSASNDAEVVVPIVAIFFVFSWLIVKAVMAPFGQRITARQRGYPSAPQPKQGLTEEEQAILVKLQRTIGQMERRIESLETILIDETRTKENYGTKH